MRVLDEIPRPIVVLDLMLRTLSGLAVHAEIVNNAEMKHVPIVIATASTLDVDYVAYTAENLARFEAAWADFAAMRS